jgi:hypothetical protein
MLQEVKPVKQSEEKTFKLIVGVNEEGNVYEEVTMFRHPQRSGELWKFDINKIPRKELQTLMLGALIQDAFQNGLVPVQKMDMRTTVKNLGLPVLFVNEPRNKED